MATLIAFGEQALRDLDVLAGTVKATLGPTGRNVVLECNLGDW